MNVPRLAVKTIVVCLAVLGVGCVSDPAVREAALDPSNPDAPQSAVAEASAWASAPPEPIAQEPAADDPGGHPHGGHDHAAPAPDAGQGTQPAGQEDPHAGHAGHAGLPPPAPVDAGTPKAAAPRVAPKKPAKAPVVYLCPMHPEVRQSTPGGRCPKCGMKLELQKPAGGKP